MTGSLVYPMAAMVALTFTVALVMLHAFNLCQKVRENNLFVLVQADYIILKIAETLGNNSQKMQLFSLLGLLTKTLQSPQEKIKW